MSRHTVLKDDQREIILGWDRPLQTFFGQVWEYAPDTEENDDSSLWQVVFEVGMIWRPPAQITELEDLLSRMSAYLPDGIPSDLEFVLLSEQMGLVNANVSTDWTDHEV
jgi:hypothetical protein